MQDSMIAVIVREKESIVVRGIRKRLDEMGYMVYEASTGANTAEEDLGQAGLFIIYLSSHIMKTPAELEHAQAYCSGIQGHGCKVIVIGEKKNREELQQAIPALSEFIWLDLPLDMDQMVFVVEKLQKAGKGGAEETEAGSAPAGEAAKTSDAAKQEEEQNRILLVDDDPSFAKMVKEWLSNDYKVDVVTTGMQAIKYLSKKTVELVLLDYEMPVMNGPKVFERLREDRALADIPVVFLTGVGDRESVTRVMQLKPKGYILKSATREELLQYLEKTLG